MRIAEPMTIASEYGLMVAGIVVVILLQREFRTRPRANQWFWIVAFAATALGALLGGTYHSLSGAPDIGARALLWKASLVLSGLPGFAILCAAAVAVVDSPWRERLLFLAQAKFVIYAAWISAFAEFRYVLFDYVPALLIVLSLYTFAAWRQQAVDAQWIVGGVLMSFAGAAVQQSNVSLLTDFTPSDLSYVMQLGALYLFYRAARCRDDQVDVRNEV